MLPSQDLVSQDSVIASLFIQAVRQGQPLWFSVASGSMNPTLRIGDQIRIEPVNAQRIQPGEIAAFEESGTLIVHRMVRRRLADAQFAFIEMGDAQFHASRVEEEAIVGRVTLVRRWGQSINLQHPVAKWCGTVTASLRYRLYCIHTGTSNNLLRVISHKCSRLIIYSGSWCLNTCCSSSLEEQQSHVTKD